LTAEDGDEGLEIAQRERPDVIVTDLSMPGMRGDELCRRVKADPDLCRTPVIIVTGRNNGDEHEQAVRAGATDVVEKPVNRISLIQAVNHVLRLAERGLARVPLETDVRLDLSGQETWARSLNVSRGGMFVELEELGPEPETELQLEFSLPEIQSALAPTAKVVWRRHPSSSTRPGLGMQFLKLDRNSARQLDEFVYERADTEATSPAPAPLPGS
jgi:uncharacterized protein (TIGR02266 family)